MHSVPIAVVELKWITGEGELLDRDVTSETGYVAPLENIVQTHPDPRARCLDNAPTPAQRRGNVIVIQAIELGVKILGEQGFFRAKLHGIRERLLEFFKVMSPLARRCSQSGIE